jgi:preprotein translocase subunit SecB
MKNPKKTQKEPKMVFQIRAIELLELNMHQPIQPLSDQTTFHYNISLEQKAISESKLVIIIATIQIIHEDKETRLASIKASCIFEVENFADFIVEDPQDVNLPEILSTSLNSITLSTVRGLMFSSLKGTFLHNAILPVIDPKSLVKTVQE